LTRDILTLVKDLPLGEDDFPETINIKYIRELCAQNWGLQQDIITSIDSCIDFMENYQFKDEVAQDIRKKFIAIKKAISDYPKSARWKLRSHIGKRLAWKKKVELENREP